MEKEPVGNIMQNLDITKVLPRIMYVLDQRIDSIQEEHKEKGEKLSKEDILTGYRKKKDNVIIEKFPISKDTYYKFNKYVTKKHDGTCYEFKKPKKGKHYNEEITLQMHTLLTICKYADVSADYLLGLIDTQRREQSAEMVRREFGLSDKSMEFLKKTHERVCETKGEVTSSLVNLILENSFFWENLGWRLPLYISSKNDGYRDADEDMLRYGLMRVFEDLVDVLVEKIKKSDEAPPAELDRTDPYVMI